MKHIEIPKNLYARVRQGIEQVEVERSRKKQWLPKIVTGIVSVATLYFILVMATDMQFLRMRTASKAEIPSYFNFFK